MRQTNDRGSQASRDPSQPPRVVRNGRIQNESGWSGPWRLPGNPGWFVHCVRRLFGKSSVSVKNQSPTGSFPQWAVVSSFAAGGVAPAFPRGLRHSVPVPDSIVSTDLPTATLLLLALAAGGVGMSKSGLAGLGMVHIVIFAAIFGARASTGVLLPLLVLGDVLAVLLVGQAVDWRMVARLLPPAIAGILLGWVLLDWLDERSLRPVVGAIILALSGLQAARLWRPVLFGHFPHSNWFAWLLGGFAGVTTMLANAAGPVVALYLLAVAMPKDALIATAAWLFLVLNVLKLPFSWQLGLITTDTLLLNLLLAPMVLLGLLAGRWVVKRIPQRLFNTLILLFTATAATRLMGLW
ncbi:MAG: sulfite exporter TauE/SafE family protein [Planctomycetota bacterium]|nr:MAG: sulfite exporter TauE/SafE family protein [Planctomycetota bacterium]